jgi:glycogen synthase
VESRYEIVTIAIFASAFYPSLGGVEELVRQLSQSLARRGDQVIILTERWPRSLAAAEKYEGIPLYRLPMRVPDGSFRAHASYVLTHRAIRAECVRILQKHRAEMLHVQCVSSSTHYALAAKRLLKLPLVVSLQGELTMDASEIFENSRFARTLMQRALTSADAITACSRGTLEEAESFHGQRFGRRAGVVYNGIRLADFAGVRPYAHPRPYILGIGRHVPQKGFDVLLRAFAASGGDHDLVLAGDGPEHEELKKLAGEVGVAERVRFTGRVDRKDAEALFAGCSFFVLPSRREPMGIVNLEAMATGKAVIASRVGGVPELVQDGETGLLVPGDDPDALSSAMNRLLADGELRNRMGEAGRVRAHGFDWNTIAAQYHEVYRRAGAGEVGRCLA